MRTRKPKPLAASAECSPQFAAVIGQLARFFQRNGYVRWQRRKRARKEGWHVYKKGHEVRLVADSKAELALIRRLLRQAGFKPGWPFVKGRQFRQPLYGKGEVLRFLKLGLSVRNLSRSRTAVNTSSTP